jgi:cytochrome c-type biogenesis protein CcmH
MSFWAFASAMIAVSLAFILRPLLRRSARLDRRQDHDLDVYRDQLSEVDRDLERGVISAGDAVAARTEIERRILRAAEIKDGPLRPDRGWLSGRLPALLLCLAIPGLALVIYDHLGSPGLPGEPFAAREGRPDNGQQDQIITQLKQRLSSNPDNADGWTLLGNLYARMGRWVEAGAAYGDALAADGQHQEALIGMAETLVALAQGLVVPEARLIFAGILEMDPKQPSALYYAGLALAQDGRLEDAYELWSNLIGAAPPQAPWLPLVQRQLARLSAEMGRQDPGTTAPGPAGPSQEDVEAAAEMSPEEREAFIRTMVQRLADRLAETPDDLDGWLRLARSYRMLGEEEQARDALLAAEALVEDLPATAPERATVAAARKAFGAGN